MQCSNPQCAEELRYLRDGRIELLELEPTSYNPERADGDGFPVKSLPSKFFWLCGDCAKTHIIKRWRNYQPCSVPSHAEHADDARPCRRRSFSPALAV
jgi:hypothetical protein